MSHTSKRKNLGITVSRAIIEKILAVGHEFDVNKNGLYDARMGAVNVWCSPEDKPSCWDIEVTQGGLNYPREYVGGLYWDWSADGKQASLFVEVEAYDLIRKKKKLTDGQWECVLDWVEDKVKGLLRLAALQADVVGTKCPFCEFILEKGRLLNELIEHIATHGNVEGVVLGNPTLVRVDGKIYQLTSVETFGEQNGP